MSSSGRGRGRGRGLLSRENVEDGSARPGAGDAVSKVVENGQAARRDSETSVVKKDPDSSAVAARKDSEGGSVAELQEALDQMCLQCSDEDLDNIYHLAESSVAGGVRIDNLAETVYEKCVSDREFAKTGAYICDKLASVEGGSVKFRSALLQQIQRDFKQKAELRNKSITKFLNIFSFLCQVFGIMRMANGEVFKVLVGPVYEFLHLILDSKQCDNDEYECLNEQLHAVGRDLELNDKEQMDALIEKVRNKIIRNGASAPVRCALLEVMECYCRGWRDLSNEVTRFYCDTMMDIITD